MKLILFLICLWISIASITYALRHPEQTDTQRLLNFKDMLLFR